MIHIPKVSVIIPVYGVEKFIERCAKTLFEQTLDDIEYIFIDDCSPDESISILKSVLIKYPFRIKQTKIIRMSNNSGLPAVRKYGIQLATGEYIIHCDSDDWVEIDMYEQMYFKAKQYNSDIIICDYYRSYDYNNHNYIHQEISLDKFSLIQDMLNDKVHGSVWNKLVRSTIYKNNKIIYPNENMCEDLALVFQLVYYSSRISKVNKPLYHYFYNSASISNDKENFEKIIQKGKQRINNYHIMEQFSHENNIYNRFINEFIRLKILSRIQIAGITGTKNGLKEWRKLSNDLSLYEIITSNVSLRQKIIYLVSFLGLYVPINLLISGNISKLIKK